jgi:hypothetical protein
MDTEPMVRINSRSVEKREIPTGITVASALSSSARTHHFLASLPELVGVAVNARSLVRAAGL